MPVYNGGDYFEKALSSALAQTYRNIEIVIVDDGSTDGGKTRAIGRRYAAAFPEKVRFFSQPNTGVAGALNHAVARMNGDIFCWLSHDDIYLPHKTETQVRFFEELGRDDAVLFSDYRLIDPDDRTLAEIRLPVEMFHRGPRVPLYRGAVNGCTIFIPTHLLKRRGGPFDTRYRYTQDYWLWFALLSKHEFFHIPEILINYRIHPEQDSHKSSAISEGEELWRAVIDRTPATEKVQMYGSQWRFLDETFRAIGNSPYQACVAYLRDQRDVVVPNTLVSVIVPYTKNDDAFRRAIASIGSQVHRPLEIIAVHHGRINDPPALSAIVGADRAVRIIDAAGKTRAAALMAGIDAANGEYVAFLAADDVMLPEKVDYQLRHMAEAGALVSQTSYFVSFPSRTGMLGFVDTTFQGGATYPSIIMDCRISLSTLMVHRTVFLDDAVFRDGDDLVQDRLFLTDLALRHDFLALSSAKTVVEWSESTPILDAKRLSRDLNALAQSFERHSIHQRAAAQIGHLRIAGEDAARIAGSGVSHMPGAFEAAFGSADHPRVGEVYYLPALADARRGALGPAIAAMQSYLEDTPPAPGHGHWAVRYWLASCLLCARLFAQADALFSTGIRIPLHPAGTFSSTSMIRCGPVPLRQPPDIRFGPREPGKGTLYVVTADDGYFRRFARAALAAAWASAPDIVAHVHLVNPEDDVLVLLETLADRMPGRLSWSWMREDLADSTAAGRRAFYSAARFLAAPEIARRYGRSLLICDIDQLVVAELTPLVKAMRDHDIGLMVVEHERANILSFVSASVVFAAHTAAALSFLDEVADYVAATCDWRADDIWHIDQAALATRMLKSDRVRFFFIPPHLMQSTIGGSEAQETLGPEVLFWSITASVPENGWKAAGSIYRRFADDIVNGLGAFDAI